MDPRLPVSRVQSMDEVMSGAVAQPRFTLVLLLGFGGLALVLAVTGIFGVVSYAVSARTQEIGIRMALGAAPRSVVWLSLRQGLTYAAFGVLAGTAGGLVATRLMRQIVYEVPTTDPLTYIAVSFIGLSIAFLACWISGPPRGANRPAPRPAERLIASPKGSLIASERTLSGRVRLSCAAANEPLLMRSA
jgi:putative ABC transport system permease protein